MHLHAVTNKGTHTHWHSLSSSYGRPVLLSAQKSDHLCAAGYQPTFNNATFVGLSIYAVFLACQVSTAGGDPDLFCFVSCCSFDIKSVLLFSFVDLFCVSRSCEDGYLRTKHTDTNPPPPSCIPMGSPSHGADVEIYVFDINHLSLPTPFHSVPVTVSVFWPFQLYFIQYILPTTLHFLTLFLSLFLPYWSFQL